MLTSEVKELTEQLRKLTAEYERRHREDKLKYYNAGPKIHRKQLEFHACPKRNRCWRNTGTIPFLRN